MYPTRLETLGIGSCMEAAQQIGIPRVSGGYSRVPVVFQPARFGCGCWIVIPKGFRGLVTSHGNYIGQRGAGLFFAPPWVAVSHLVPEQYIVYDTPVKECPTKDNVMVTIDVCIILRVVTDDEEAMRTFCYNLGPRGLDEMLRAFQEESIRGMARKRKYNEIYDLMDSQVDEVLDQTVRELNAHFKNYGVEISSVSVTNVHLPHEFAANMEEATVWHDRNEFNTLEQKFKLRNIETREAEAKDKQRCKEDLDKYIADKDAEVAAVNKKRQLVLAVTNKMLAAVREQERYDVLSIQQENQLAVAKIDAEKDISIAKITSEGEAEADQIKIHADTYVMEKRAEAKRIVATNNAKGLDMTAKAESFAAKALMARRTYEAKMRQLQTMRALGNNPQVAIAGDSKDNVMAQLLANQMGGAILGIGKQ